MKPRIAVIAFVLTLVALFAFSGCSSRGNAPDAQESQESAVEAGGAADTGETVDDAEMANSATATDEGVSDAPVDAVEADSAGAADALAEASESATVSDKPAPDPYSQPFYVLVMGLDTRAGCVEQSTLDPRSDIMILVRVDPETYEIGELSIQRDTLCYFDDAYHKINDAYLMLGPEGAIEQVELLTGVKADYYMTSTFVGFEDLVNGLGGVDCNVPIYMERKDAVHGDMIYVNPGEQRLNGAGALIVARERYGYSWNGAVHRETLCREMVRNMIRQVAADPDAVAYYSDLFYATCETNMPREDFDAYVQRFLGHADEIDFVDGATPYDNDMDEELDMWITFRDEETSRACVQAIENHENPQEIVPLPDTY